MEDDRIMMVSSCYVIAVLVGQRYFLDVANEFAGDSTVLHLRQLQCARYAENLVFTDKRVHKSLFILPTPKLREALTPALSAAFHHHYPRRPPFFFCG